MTRLRRYADWLLDSEDADMWLGLAFIVVLFVAVPAVLIASGVR